MANAPVNRNYLDFYTANNDFTTRSVTDEIEDVAFREGSSVRIWYNEQTERFAPHWHNALEVIMPIENYYDVDVAGESFRVNPDEIFFIPPREIHELIAPPTGKRFIFLFDIEPIAKLTGFSGIAPLLAKPLHFSKENYPYIYDDIYQYMVQIRNEYFYRNEYAELSIMSILIQIFVKFGYNHINGLELFQNTRINKQKEYVQIFNEIMDYIDQNYTEDLTLEGVAEKSGYSKFHFSRIFKMYTNFTFYEYLTYKRISVAKSLLIEPDLTITEVALRSGFPSISTFNRIFKTEMQCTPSAYRSQNSQVHFSRTS